VNTGPLNIKTGGKEGGALEATVTRGTRGNGKHREIV
jgi:hypothetical protein